MDIKVIGNDVEKALKDLKRKLQRDGLFSEIKKRDFYLKPSKKRKEKERLARKKRLKALRNRRGPAVRPKK